MKSVPASALASAPLGSFGSVAARAVSSTAQHRDGASFTQILDYTEQGKSTLHKGINRLLERGLIARERQTYTLTDTG